METSLLMSDATNVTGSAQKNNSLYKNLSFKDRVRGFLLFAFLGYLLQLGGLMKYISAFANLSPSSFFFVYTLGNIFSIGA